MPWHTSCELASACGLDLTPADWMLAGSPQTEAYDASEPYAGNATVPDCDPFTILATVCAEMSGMSGCTRYSKLCAQGTEVAQCVEYPPLANFTSVVGTQETWDDVQVLCSFHAVHLGREFNGTVSWPADQAATTAAATVSGRRYVRLPRPGGHSILERGRAARVACHNRTPLRPAAAVRWPVRQLRESESACVWRGAQAALQR